MTKEDRRRDIYSVYIIYTALRPPGQNMNANLATCRLDMNGKSLKTRLKRFHQTPAALFLLYFNVRISLSVYQQYLNHDQYYRPSIQLKQI